MLKKVTVALFLCFICISGLANVPNYYDQSVTKTITELMQQQQIPGAAVAIVDHRKSYIYVFGVANKSINIPVSKKTIFEVGSITKIFTALEFVATSNNRHGLNDPITKYSMVGDYQQLNKNKYLWQISMEKLLTHTSGLPCK